MKTPVHLVAHRGNARDFPENTLPALQSAVDLGVRFVEFDVQMASDLVPVVIHDDDLQRTAGVPGSVFERSSSQLAALEVNEDARFGGRYRGVRIPLLTDVVAFLDGHPAVTAFVEIKRASLRHFGTEAVAAKILETLWPVRTHCAVISFDMPAVHLARQGGFDIGWALTDYDEHARLKCEALRPEFLFCNHEKLPPDGSRLWKGPWRWALYEVATPELARGLLQRGADLIETMAVASMVEALRHPRESGDPSSAGKGSPLSRG